MTSLGRNGVTRSWSKVPSSRSRATDMAVSIMVIIIVIVPISDGIMFQRVSRLGLYQARVVTRTRGTGQARAPTAIPRRTR